MTTEEKREREDERERLCFSTFTPQIPPQPDLDQEEARHLELHFGLLHEWQGLRRPVPSFATFPVALAGNWIRGRAVELKQVLICQDSGV